jgi:hypothetical protein
LSRASAWISSTITVRTVDSITRPPWLVSRMNSDSGVVTSTCGGRRLMPARALAGVSPVRTSTRTSGSEGSRSRSAASGAWRFFWTSWLRARSGET